jgi:hydrogenase nickel incorporation protein HypA/HybF
MHELSIAAGIVEIVSEEAMRRGCKVEAVHLKVGALSGVVREALEFSWDVARSDSPVAEARLEIDVSEGAELQVTALEILDNP